MDKYLKIMKLLEPERVSCDCYRSTYGCECGNNGDAIDAAVEQSRNTLRKEIKTALDEIMNSE